MDTMTALAILAIIFSCVFFTLAFTRMSYFNGEKRGYLKAHAEITDATLKDALENGRVTMPGYEDNCFVTWTMGDRFPGTLAGFVHLTHKLAGEAGEFNEHWGKAIRDDEVTYRGFINGKLELTPQRREALIKELGDILWYVAMLARELGSSLVGVALANMKKLASRRERNVIQGSGDDR